MNKVLLLLLFVLSLVITDSARSQSTFVFRNKYGGVNAPIFDSGGLPLAGTNYHAELYGSVSPDSLTPATTIGLGQRGIISFLTGTNAGYFLSGELLVSDAWPGGSAWLQVRAWDARLGATYESVSGLGIGGYGESSLFYADGGDPTMMPAQIGSPLLGLQSFSLRPVVPEPSALALLGLGSVSLWFFAGGRAKD